MPGFPGRAAVLLALATLLASGCRPGDATSQEAETTYVCPPCAPHDTLTFEHDGTCPVCGMKLIERPDSSLVGHVHLREGSSNFLVRGGTGRGESLITVFYHKPGSFTPESPVLLVIPGSGRDAWEYRDAWVEASEEHGVLVLSPWYPEPAFDFGDYHMGGVMEEKDLMAAVEEVEGSHEVRLDEEALAFEVNARPEEWIFDDFDRIFETASSAVGSIRDRYDIFGHSAGGQILHRSVLFHPESKAHRILAANSGFYTLPDVGSELPFGLKGTPVGEEELRASFRQRLVLFLGGEDDDSEAGGIFLRSPSADAQGPGRLQRGRHFYDAGRAKAGELGAEFDWKLEVVPGVGHDFRRMSEAAADYLYGEGGSG